MKSAIDDDRKCRACGCTDERACPGGCWWVEWDLCSACRETAYAAGTPVARGPVPAGFVPASCLRCRRPLLVLAGSVPPLEFDPVSHDKGKPQGYLFTHDCPCGDEDDYDGPDFDPDDGPAGPYGPVMPEHRGTWPESWAAYGYAPEHRGNHFVFDDDDDFDGEV